VDVADVEKSPIQDHSAWETADICPRPEWLLPVCLAAEPGRQAV